MIKLFEQFNNEQEIHDICKEYKIKNYTINPDGSIDVDGDVNLSFDKLDKLPLRFNRVGGDFTCMYNNLTTLRGCPNYVGGSFGCGNNQLTSLEGCPKEVGDTFYCPSNKLTSLEGLPSILNDELYINNNPISIIDISTIVRNNIDIRHTNFDGEIKNLSQEKLRILFEHGVDYVVFRKDGSINDSRLERLFKDFNI